MHLFQGIRKRISIGCLNFFLSGKTCWKLKRWLLVRAGHTIGKDTKIVGPIYCSGNLIIGERCWVGRDFTVNGNGIVTIGSDCDIGPDVSFQTGGHLIGPHERRAGKGIHCEQQVGNGVWIGARATFVNSVIVGDGSVIASCACVANDVPRNVLVGGVPAKIIRELDE